MLDPQKIDELATSLNRLVPESLRDAGDDIKANFRAVAQSWFDRLDLVTREEFDAQQAVLARTREKLDQIEQQLAQD
ncbi:MAG: accessory factor UbiK family protein [Lysobacterales bacterium]